MIADAFYPLMANVRFMISVTERETAVLHSSSSKSQIDFSMMRTIDRHVERNVKAVVGSQIIALL